MLKQQEAHLERKWTLKKTLNCDIGTELQMNLLTENNVNAVSKQVVTVIN